MRFLTSMLACLLLALPAAARAQAQQGPVVVELFTSQGCTACPPADALLARLAARDDVLALALHVDYWDYLGWTDSFGEAAYTARQRAYAKAMRNRSVFTPQVIVQGHDMLIGHDAESINARIATHEAKGSRVTVEAVRDRDALRIKLTPTEPDSGGAEVYLVKYLPSADVVIGGGENAGKRMRYVNIVTDWSTIARWDGQAAEVNVADVGDGPLAVIVQRERFGPVLGAAQLE